MTVRRQKNRVTKTRIQGIANLMLLLGLLGGIVAIITLIDLDVWYNPVFWIALAVLLIGTGIKLWRPAVVEPVELLNQEIAAFQASEESLIRASVLPPTQQHSELLRATGQIPATPAEELLRATTTTKRDD